MVRKIVVIDREKCNGCGACAQACHEHAIGMVDGKAELLRDDYCDGLGDCLPACPTGAISFEVREAADYDEKAVQENIASKKAGNNAPGHEGAGKIERRLKQWPCQIKLVPANAAFLKGARLLVAADCTAYAYGDFHRDFMDGRTVLVGCTKLDGVNYSEKFTDIFRNNDIQDVVVARMEVPCCGGMEIAVKNAAAASRKEIPVRVVTITTDGKIKEEA